MKLIVGLGNPGKKYLKTRHNVGFMVLDELHNRLEECSISEWELSKKFNAEICGCTVHNEKIILAKPMTFMNASGEAVQIIAHYYKLSPWEIIVIHDDKDLKLGEFKIQSDRGPAGHNGVSSIIQCIGSKDFARYRIGIAPDNPEKIKNTADFVLGKFGLLEKNKLKQVIDKSIIELIKNLFNKQI